jgi:two-component system sensor histidine kinase PilS (NtrC family)
MRLLVVSTLFVGILLIQVNTQLILPLRSFYGLILLTYGLSLVSLILYVRRIPLMLQASIQLGGDLVVVTGFVYVTGGVFSPFSFFYLAVIIAAATLIPAGGMVFAGLSAIAYGLQALLMYYQLLPPPANLEGIPAAPSAVRVLSQMLIHFVSFALVAMLVSYLTQSLKRAHSRIEEESERAAQFVALTEHVVRSVGAGILAADLDGEVLYINPAGAAILGIDDVEAQVGRSLDEVMPLAEHNWGLIATRARLRSITRIEASLESSNARVGLSVDPLRNEHATVVGFIVNYKDLTELRIEAERERLRDRMAATGKMAARMAHEIKNPLASISGSAQMLGMVSGIDETGRRLLNIVVDESRRLSGILDGFLVFARPGQTTQSTCDLSALLTDCVALLRRSDEIAADHELVLHTPPELELLGQEDLLRQVFWNLSRNALQAMPDGGRLTITAKRHDQEAEIRWRDTGVGMSEETRQHAFEPFVTTQNTGTGLGLAVVYSAVREHGGSVDIVSSPDRGTTVTVKLPLVPEEA